MSVAIKVPGYCPQLQFTSVGNCQFVGLFHVLQLGSLAGIVNRNQLLMALNL
jgi:hypothetical protein